MLTFARAAAAAAIVSCVALAAPAKAADLLLDRAFCALPAELATLGADLPATREALLGRQELRVLAIGSSSTEGVGASTLQHSYPAVLEAELRRRFPDSAASVLNAGIGGETVAPMLLRLKRLVEEHRPQLVVWQTATNDVLRGIPLDEFDRELLDGLGWLASRGIDVVLMEPQYTPIVSEPAAYEGYTRHLTEVGRRQSVPVHLRYDMTRLWEERAANGGASIFSPDRLHLSDLGYRCTAQSLADGIEQAVRVPAELQAAVQPAAQ